MRIEWFVLGILASAACGSDDEYPLFPPGTDGGLLRDASTRDASDGSLPDDSLPVAPDAQGDGIAPVITLVNPDPGALIAGVFRLDVEVVDQGGVDTVTASIGGIQNITLVDGPGDLWSGTFDTFPLAGLVAPTVVVRARDLTGLEAELGFVITLDNVAPLGALDPPRVRTTTQGSQDELVCSVPLDPVGGDAPDDGESVAQLFELRARVADLGNTGTIGSTLFIPNAGVERVEVYVFDDSDQPLVVDSDGDAVCDRINPKISPASVPMLANEAAVVELRGIAPTGSGSFTPTTFGGSNASVCTSGTDNTPAAALCLGEPSSSIAIQTITGEPQIFGIPPVNDFNCLGFAFDARASNISDGFACVALLVTDKLGNQSVSAPIRICIDSDQNGIECLPTGQLAPAANRPSCTGTFTPANGTVTDTACTPRRFFSGGSNEFELVEQ